MEEKLGIDGSPEVIVVKSPFCYVYDQFRTERLPFRRISEKSLSFWDINSYIYEQKIAGWIIIPIFFGIINCIGMNFIKTIGHD